MMHLVRRVFMALIFPLRVLVTSPTRLFSTGQRMFGVSLPARVAVLIGFFLLICVVISAIAFFCWPEHSFFAPFRQLWYLTTVLTLVIVIPVVVYHVLRLWLEGEVSPFEDIKRAWVEGIAELERQGLDISEIPLFLILGSDGEQREKALFDAAGLSLNLREFPQGPRPLHWYANPDGIYVVCTDAGCLSRLAHVAKHASDDRHPVFAEPTSGPSGGAGIRGTIVAGSEPPQTPAGESSPSEPIEPSATGYGDIRGTMELGGASAISRGESDSVSQGAAGLKPVVLLPAERNLQERRLEYVCRLIRHARRPVCPVNGVLTLLPFGMISRGPREGIELQKALQSDLGTAHRSLNVRCPVTAAVIGMEEESGFQELVRRVGRDRAARQRFGKGFSLSNPPIPERVEALAMHACGSFEAFVYALFREKGSLSKPGNTRLYALLCKIRRNVQTRLGNILVAGFGADLEQEPDAGPFFFGGCYFAAVGETDDRQAFVRGILDKMPDEQAELEWTESALVEDRRYRRIAHLVIGLDLLLFGALGWMVVSKAILSG
jgi:hypothetical protein